MKKTEDESGGLGQGNNTPGIPPFSTSSATPTAPESLRLLSHPLHHHHVVIVVTVVHSQQAVLHGLERVVVQVHRCGHGHSTLGGSVTGTATATPTTTGTATGTATGPAAGGVLVPCWGVDHRQGHAVKLHVHLLAPSWGPSATTEEEDHGGHSHPNQLV